MVKIWIFTLILIGINLFLNLIYRQELYHLGVSMIQNIQSHSNPIFTFLLVIVTMIVDPALVAVYIIIGIVFLRKKTQVYVIVIFILINVLAIGMLKASYADPRPYWTSQNVKSLSPYCPRQYGNPSGHSWFSCIIAFILLEYYSSRKKYIICVTCIILAVPFSRMYLGAHSLNQVLQGVYLGLAFNILYISIIKEQIKQIILPKRQFGKITFIFITTHIVNLIIYWYNNKYQQQLPKQYIINIKYSCSYNSELSFKDQTNFKMLVANSSLITLIYAIILGISSLKLDSLVKSYLNGEWCINQHQNQLRIGYIKFLFYNFVCLLCGLIVAPIIFLVQNKILILIIINIGLGLSGYAYTNICPNLLEKYKIITKIENFSINSMQEIKT